MLDKRKLLEVCYVALQNYAEKYNEENSAFVTVNLDDTVLRSDHGLIEVDGGDTHGAWILQLGEL